MYTWIPLNSSADLMALDSEISAEYDPKNIIKKLNSHLSSAVKAILMSVTTSIRITEVRTTTFMQKKGNSIEPIVYGFTFSMKPLHSIRTH
jgi:hypothetical protein